MSKRFSSPFAQPQTGAATVLVDELHAGRFQGVTNG
jgi:hypothetical protein